jgi:phospholipid/cholesterol/gamma-HCH transport system substrate-binding protein
MRRGDPVQLRGVNIGRVKSFEIKAEGVVVDLEIEDEFMIPRDSRVTIKSGGILGGMVAEVIAGVSSEPVREGDELPGSTGETLTDVAERVAVESARVLERMQTVLSDRTIAGIESSTVEFADLLKNLSAGVMEQRASLVALSASLGRSATNLEQITGPGLQRSVSRLDALTRGMETLSPRVQSSIESLDRSAQAAAILLGRIEDGQGTLGRLTKDDALYQNANRTLANLNRAAVELRLLGEDVRRNPGRYVKLSLF